MIRSIAAVAAAAILLLLLHADTVHPTTTTTGRVFPPFVDHIDDHHHDNVPREKAKIPKFKERYKFPQVTHVVYFDVVIPSSNEENDDKVVVVEEPTRGRIILGLFGQVAPQTVENFRSLCVCDGGIGQISNVPLCYKGTTFHRVIPNFGIQGGDITHNNGQGGESIYGGYFDDETTFTVPHIKYYMLYMANKGRKNTNGSQFFINTVKTSWLANKAVIFGMVLEGFEYVDDIEYYGTPSGRPLVNVIIEESGELPLLTSTAAAAAAAAETFMEEI